MLGEATQSSLGDCYLVAAMSALGERPQLLEDIFITKHFNMAGIYALKLYIRGKPWIVTVDDTFLFHTDQNNLRFAKFDPSHNTLWGPILEKAVAKAKGNYY